MERNAQARYAWMAVAALLVIAAGKLLFPFAGQQRAQNISLVVEAVVGATVGLAACRRFRERGG